MTHKSTRLWTCDRCGLEMTNAGSRYPEENPSDWLAVGTSGLIPGRALDPDPQNHGTGGGHHLDLCATCSLSFANWLESRKAKS